MSIILNHILKNDKIKNIMFDDDIINDPYIILQSHINSDCEIIKKNHKLITKKYHPDKNNEF